MRLISHKLKRGRIYQRDEKEYQQTRRIMLCIPYNTYFNTNGYATLAKHINLVNQHEINH